MPYFIHVMRSRALKTNKQARHGRHRGVSLWLFVATLPIICGACGLVIDVGQLHARRAQAQRAADAAALAGAEVSDTTESRVQGAAVQYVNLNGFSAASGDQISVETNYNSNTLDNAATTNTVKVGIAHQETVFFAPICETLLSAMGWSSGAAQFSRRVTARAVARRYVFLPESTGGNYGIASGSQSVVNNIINGPNARYDDADPYSCRYMPDGSPNPLYSEYGGYQNFTFHVSDAFKNSSPDGKVYLQIYDPGSNDPSYNGYIGVNYKFPSGVATPAFSLTTTKYEVLKDGNVIASATYGGAADPNSDLKWTTPGGFAFDINTYGTGDYHVRVSTLDGNTSNGYALRAGPAGGLNMKDDATWNQTYGDKLGTDPNNIAVPMNADGRMTIGFQTNGTATMELGHLSAAYAGKTVYVKHFDLDIGATALSYGVDSLPNTTFPGTLPQDHYPDPNVAPRPGNGVWATDSVTLPLDFQGGNLTAKYTAGVSNIGKDGSAWELFGEGDGPGFTRLVE